MQVRALATAVVHCFRRVSAIIGHLLVASSDTRFRHCLDRPVMIEATLSWSEVLDGNACM